MPSADGRPMASDARPMRGGPARKPRYPVVATAASAVPAGIPGTRPAPLKSSGMMLAIPRPTIPQPTTPASGVSMRSAAPSPSAAVAPDARSTRRAPKRAARPSPARRPTAIARENAAKPAAASAGLVRRVSRR